MNEDAKKQRELQKRRLKILAKIEQLKIDSDSWNENQRKPGEPKIELDFDFTSELEEAPSDER